MNFEFSSLSELEQLVSTLFAESKCACHVINPHKTRILLWKEEKNGQITYYLRIGIQRFISQPQTDRNGEIYWKFQAYNPEVKGAQENPKVSERNQQPTDNLNPTEKKTELDPISKFQQRQTKTEQINSK